MAAAADHPLVRTHSISLGAATLSLLVAGNAAMAQTGDTSGDTAAVDPHVQEARDQYREGVAAFRARHFGDAVVSFERSFRLRPHPTTLYNEAEARFRAGDREEAISELRRVIGMTEPAPDTATIERARTLAREAGVDDLQPTAPETHECPPIPQCPPARECPVCPPPSTGHTVTHGPVPFVLAGAGLVLIATGMTFYGYSLGDAYAYNHPSNQGSNPALDTALRDQGNAFRWVGFTSFIVGLVAEGLGIYTYLTPPAAPATTSARRTSYPTARLDVAPNGLVLSGTF